MYSAPWASAMRTFDHIGTERVRTIGRPVRRTRPAGLASGGDRGQKGMSVEGGVMSLRFDCRRIWK
ncbi:unannotated protein [freshwater metagenome]|uniref:Unannotated protein n=1 Tax=freshwater metagenome TaxID=449393 RepID=A0A6J6ECF8_9ZZZZ